MFLECFKDMSYDDSIMDFNVDAANGIAMEGYLYKRASNAFKTWSRYDSFINLTARHVFACPTILENA